MPSKTLTRIATYWDVLGSVASISPFEHYALIWHHPKDYKVLAIATGEIIFALTKTHEGMPYFSEDERFLIIPHVSSRQLTEATFIDLISHNKHVDIEQSLPHFRQLPTPLESKNLKVIQDTTAKKLQLMDKAQNVCIAEFEGYHLAISPDEKYLVVENQGKGQVIEIETMKLMLILDTDIYHISPDSNYIAVETLDGGYVRVYEINTGQVIASTDLFWFDSFSFTQNNHWLRLSSMKIGIQDIFDLQSNTIIFKDLASFKELKNGNILTSTRHEIVDLYGHAESRIATMPKPRPDPLVGTVAIQQATLFKVPANEPITTINQHTTCYILGRLEATWFYVGVHHFRGWVEIANLKIDEPWDDAPILDPADPLGSLREISEAQ